MQPIRHLRNKVFWEGEFRTLTSAKSSFRGFLQDTTRLSRKKKKKVLSRNAIGKASSQLVAHAGLSFNVVCVLACGDASTPERSGKKIKRNRTRKVQVRKAAHAMLRMSSPNTAVKLSHFTARDHLGVPTTGHITKMRIRRTTLRSFETNTKTFRNSLDARPAP